MSGAGAAEVLGAFFVGVVAGFFLLRELLNWAGRQRADHGPCELCSEIAYLVLCKRCGRWVGMCCYWGVLSADTPLVRIRKRKGAHVCVRCLEAVEKETLEKLVG